jgi:predicted dehydrogenase
MMGHIVLFNSEFRRLLAEVSDRPPLTFISCVRHRPASTPELYPGESPFHLLMVHDLYAVLALVRRREPVEFTAQVRKGPGKTTDLALAQMRWDDGLVASFVASFLTPDGMPADGYDRIELYGNGWAARIDPNPRPLSIWDDRWRAPMTHEIGADPRDANGMLAEEIRCFCRVVRGTGSMPIGASYADALQVLRWTDALVRAAEGGTHP